MVTPQYKCPLFWPRQGMAQADLHERHSKPQQLERKSFAQGSIGAKPSWHEFSQGGRNPARPTAKRATLNPSTNCFDVAHHSFSPAAKIRLDVKSEYIF